MVFNLHQGVVAGAAGAATGGYSVDNSIVLDDGSSQYLTGPTLSGGSERIGTYSFWTKRANLGTQQEIYTQYRTSSSNLAFRVRFLSGDTLDIVCENDAGGVILRRTTTQVFRDPHAFLHVHIQIDGNQTDDTCCTLSINGSAVSDFSTKTNLSSATNLNLFTSSKSAFIGSTPGPAGYYDGYLSEFVVIDANNVADTSFGEYDTNGVWRPVDVSGLTFGSNGFYLDFAASGDLGNDVSGNNNDFTPSGSPTQSSDTPTNIHPTFSPLAKHPSKATLSNGNKTYVSSTTSGDVGRTACSWLLPTAGKWYWEVVVDDAGVTPSMGWRSIKDLTQALNVNSTFLHTYFAGVSGSNEINYYGSDATSTGTAAYGNATASGFTPFVDGDVIGIAYDADNNLCWAHANGTWVDGDGTDSSATVLAEIEAGTSGSEAFTADAGGVGRDDIVFEASSRSVSNPWGYTVRFEEADWGYSAPSGFSALNSANLYANAAPAIEDGTAHFQGTLYTGNGSDGHEINQSGYSTFQPDLLWVKSRSSGSSHCLFDAVRGASERVFSNLTNAEATSTEYLASFDADGFTMNDNDPIGVGDTNVNTRNYVGWQWKGDNTSGATNTDGTITTTVNVNSTAGFSILKYTGNGTDGATIGHGLGAIPDMAFFKRTSDTSQWTVHHKGLTGGISGTYGLEMNTNGAQTITFGAGYADGFTSTVCALQDGSTNATNVNTSGSTYLGIFFTSIPGYSAFGSYAASSGNPLIILDFTPAFAIFKRIDSTGEWPMFDNARDPYYDADSARLYADTADTENTGTDRVQFGSNFIKITAAHTSADPNVGGTYIYAAFAENPFAGSSPATAR